MKLNTPKLLSILFTVVASIVLLSFSPDSGNSKGKDFYSNYRIISAYDISALETRVNNEILSGWQPMGAVSVNSSKGEYFQAVVK